MSAEQLEFAVEEEKPEEQSSAPEVEPRVEQTEEPPSEPASEPAVKAAEPRSETDRLDPPPLEKKLASGTEYELEPLKLRQFLRLLRIVTRGASDVLDTARLDFDDPEGFVSTFLGIVLFSIPEAEDESIEFLKSMVRPKGLTGDTRRDLPKMQDLERELDNPELDDTLTIIQTIIEAESEDLRALGKRLMTMFEAARKMGATRTKSDSTAA